MEHILCASAAAAALRINNKSDDLSLLLFSSRQSTNLHESLSASSVSGLEDVSVASKPVQSNHVMLLSGPVQ
jgi:hypothetical protein